MPDTIHPHPDRWHFTIEGGKLLLNRAGKFHFLLPAAWAAANPEAVSDLVAHVVSQETAAPLQEELGKVLAGLGGK